MNVYRISVLPEEKKSWGLVAQNVNVLNMEMGQVVDPMSSSFKPYLAFLALGRLTYKMLASVTGSGDTLGGGVFCHLKPHVTVTIIVLIKFI